MSQRDISGSDPHLIAANLPKVEQTGREIREDNNQYHRAEGAQHRWCVLHCKESPCNCQSRIFQNDKSDVFDRKISQATLFIFILLISPYSAADAAAAAAAKSLQSCPTLCDPRDGSPPGSPVPGILQARTLEWVAISFSNAGK